MQLGAKYIQIRMKAWQLKKSKATDNILFVLTRVSKKLLNTCLISHCPRSTPPRSPGCSPRPSRDAALHGEPSEEYSWACNETLKCSCKTTHQHGCSKCSGKICPFLFVQLRQVWQVETLIENIGAYYNLALKEIMLTNLNHVSFCLSFFDFKTCLHRWRDISINDQSIFRRSDPYLLQDLQVL